MEVMTGTCGDRRLLEPRGLATRIEERGCWLLCWFIASQRRGAVNISCRLCTKPRTPKTRQCRFKMSKGASYIAFRCLFILIWWRVGLISEEGFHHSRSRTVDVASIHLIMMASDNNRICLPVDLVENSISFRIISSRWALFNPKIRC